MDELVVHTLVGSLLIVLPAGPLGCFVVWRRMAYFGDALAHTAVLGVGLGFILDIAPGASVLVLCPLAALVVARASGVRLPVDSLLGVMAHGALAFGVILVAFAPAARGDFFVYLFGDILAVSLYDLLVLGGIALVILASLAALWRPLLLMTIDAALARAEGVPIERIRTIFLVLLGVFIALAMRLTGALLIMALLIIPAATARLFASSATHMAVLAVFLGILSVAGGLAASFLYDTPAGPSIAAACACVFVASAALRPHMFSQLQ